MLLRQLAGYSSRQSALYSINAFVLSRAWLSLVCAANLVNQATQGDFRDLIRTDLLRCWQRRQSDRLARMHRPESVVYLLPVTSKPAAVPETNSSQYWPTLQPAAE